MNDIKKGIQYAFQTKNNMTLAMSGSGHAAMECAVFNTVEPGESVLISINGIWGERVAEIAERMGRFLRTGFTHARPGSPKGTKHKKFITLLTTCLINTFICIDKYDRFVLPVGANVHKLEKAPGGYFTNKEIEQVGTIMFENTSKVLI